MDVSLFEVLGPVMIGPSSSHTAGAARLGRAARMIAGKPFVKVEFGLHGSFAKTGRGHGTHKALLAGALGLHEEDERLRDAFELAQQAEVDYNFYELELPDAHENSARITFFHTDGTLSEIEGSSIGGGRIRITSIDGTAAGFSAEAPTLLITQRDVQGVVSGITGQLAAAGLNIGVMRVSRKGRGETATTIIETDSPVPSAVADSLRRLPEVLSVRVVDLNTKEDADV